MQNTTMSEREIIVAHDGADIEIRDEHNRIRLRPAQVVDAASSIMEVAERIRPGSWPALWQLLREVTP